MNLKQTSLATSIVVALSSSSVYAAVAPGVFIGGENSSHGKENTPVVIAAEQTISEGSNTIKTAPSNKGALNITIPIPASYPVDNSAGGNLLFLDIRLKGGAKFAKEATLFCKTTTSTNGGFVEADPLTGVVSLNKTRAAFNMKSGYTIAAGDSAVCILSNAIDKTSGATYTAFFQGLSTNTAQTVSAIVRYKRATTQTTVPVQGTFITFKQSLGFKALAKDYNGDLTNAVLDVRESSKKFSIDNPAPTTNATQAVIGSFYYASNTAGATATLTQTGGNVDADDMLTGFNITVSGPVAGASKFTLHNGANCNTTPVATTTPSSGGVATFTNVAPSNITGGAILAICMTLNGVDIIQAGQLKVAFNPIAATGWSPNAGTEQDIHNLIKNGSEFRVLNIPNPTNQDQAFIRLYNANNFTTMVYGIMYGQDGKQIGEQKVLDINTTAPTPLAANEVRILTAANLATIFGTTTWTGRARLIVSAEAENFYVQSLMRGPSNVLVNLSAETRVDSGQ